MTSKRVIQSNKGFNGYYVNNNKKDLKMFAPNCEKVDWQLWSRLFFGIEKFNQISLKEKQQKL